MSTFADSLTAVSRAAAVYIDEHGWTQGTMEDGQGRVCLTGALKACAPVPGDFGLARQVYKRRGRAENWNDAAERTATEVRGYLDTAEISDADLLDTFGPQWPVIVTVVRTLAAATPGQLERLAAARDAARDAAGDAAWAAAWAAAGVAAGDAAWVAAWVAAGVAAGVAARDAVWAFVVADLVGQHGLTAEHIEILTGPYVSVFGAPVPVESEMSA